MWLILAVITHMLRKFVATLVWSVSTEFSIKGGLAMIERNASVSTHNVTVQACRKV